MAYWSYIAPVEKTNLLRNPSLERDSTDWSSQTGVAVRASSAQAFGAWCYQIPANTSGTLDIVAGTINAGVGSAYTASLYADVEAGKTLRVGLRTSGNYAAGAWVGSTATTTVAGMQRYSASYTEASGGGSRYLFAYIETASPTTAPFSVDGAQIEAGSITTYIDGDQEGCSWLGAPHASQSTRSGQSRAGGSVIPLSAIGFTADESPGIGMPTVENSSQSFAIVPGAEFQRQRARERTFTLSSYLTGTSWANLHQLRAAAINAFKIDAVTPQQPTRFLYTGGLGTVQIDAIYDGGLEFGKPDGFEETPSVRFIAYQPYWTGVTDEGTALAPRVNIGSANFVVKRDSLGRWGTLGANGSTVQNMLGNSQGGIRTLLYNNGTLLMGGSFGTVGGTTSPNVGMYFPATNLFGTFVGGTLTAQMIRDMVYAPWGSVYVGGIISAAGGTTVRGLAQWNSAGWGSINGGTLGAAEVWALALSPFGTLFVGGDFTLANGTTSPAIAQWRNSNSSWGSLGGGTVTSTAIVRDIAIGLDYKVYLGGNFTEAGGTTAARIAQWSAAGFGTMGAGADFDVYQIVAAPNGQIIATGLFGSIGGAPANNVGLWNGVAWSAAGSGLQNTTGAGSQARAAVVDPKNGVLYTGGVFRFAGGIGVPDSAAQWNGYSWNPLDIDLNQQGTIHALALAPDRTLYAGGTFAGTANCAAVAQIVNTGMAEVYPTMVTRNTGSGTARLYQLANTLTGDYLFFNVTLQPGETATLDLTPGARSFTSDFQGNLFGRIQGGSNIATWRLLSGTNWVSFFGDSDSLVTSFYWRPRSWSADGGTAY